MRSPQPARPAVLLQSWCSVVAACAYPTCCNIATPLLQNCNAHCNFATPRRIYPAIADTDLIVIILWSWLLKIYNLTKLVEIRPCRPSSNHIFFAASRSSQVSGSAVVYKVLGPLSDDEWAELRSLHLVDGKKLYDKTYAWFLTDVRRFEIPIKIKRKKGAVGLQKGRNM